MREIKFRAWDTVNKAMIWFELDYFKYYQDEKSFVTHALGRKDPIMQYIGLKDKNKIEIYEGDIVEFEYNKSHDKFIDVIEWDNRYNGWGDWYNFTPNWCKIIGNIYENPELLKT